MHFINCTKIHTIFSCGGIIMENINFFELPPVDEDTLLKSLQFIPILSPHNNVKVSNGCSLVSIVFGLQ